MKKILLFALTACFTMGMSAQTFKMEKSLEYSRNNSFVQTATLATPRVAAKKANKVAVCDGKDESHSLWGNYIEIYDGGENIMNTMPVLVEKEVDNETGAVYAVMSGMFGGYGEQVYGLYDEEAKTITVEAGQGIGTVSNGSGAQFQTVLFGAEPAEQEGYLNFRGEVDEEGNILSFYDLVFDVVEDESGIYLTLQEGGWVLIAYTSLDEDGQSAGMISYNLEGETLNKTNWMAHYYASHVTSGGWGDWEEQEFPVYVEKLDESVVVYGFEQELSFEIGLNAAEKTATLANQNVYYYNDNNSDRMYSIFGLDEKGEITNTLDHETGGVYDEEMEYIAIINPETKKGNMFYVCTPYEPGVGAYMFGVYDTVEFWSMCGEIGMGINTVLAPEVSTKAGRFNLAGQRVNTYTKGINIENGKKVVR